MILKRREGKRGAAAVELAALLPFLVFLGVIATDWARVLYFTISIENCARNGALWMCDTDIQYRSQYASAEDAAKAEAPTLSGLTVVTADNVTLADNTI